LQLVLKDVLLYPNSGVGVVLQLSDLKMLLLFLMCVALSQLVLKHVLLHSTYRYILMKDSCWYCCCCFYAAALQLVLKDVLLYPNSVSVPLMTNFGVPPEPQGMVKVTLTRIENLKTTDLLTKGDPYVVFEVRLWL
jgi:hypothetical protein